MGKLSGMSMEIIPFSDGTGQVQRLANFPSSYITPRHVDIWLPPGYTEQAEVRYPVLYMHDGQNLFDPALSYIGVDWGMNEAVLRWMERTGRPGAIVVGVWNTPKRVQEYMPQRPLAAPGAELALKLFVKRTGGMPCSDAYLRFLVAELKPFVDAHYRTLPDRTHTCVMGSSMGGLISLYALCEYPQVYGGAGCISTHWPIGGKRLVNAMGAALPRAEQHRLYFDFGTLTVDKTYEPFQQWMDRWGQAAGYRQGVDWLMRKFEGAEHSERAWRARVDLPVGFLLGE